MTYRLIRRFLLLVLASLALPLHAEPSGLVSWWQAENNTLDTLNHNNGTGVGSVGYAPGAAGLAFSFDGSSYLSVSNATFNAYASSFSVAAWIKISSYNQAPSIINLRTAPNSSGFTLESYYNNPGTMLWAVNQTGVSEGFAFLTSTGWVQNIFFHVTATFDAATGTMAMYRNGIQVAYTNGLPHVNMATVANPQFQIGRNIVGSFAWNGLIDDVRFYDHALSPAEVASLFDCGTAGGWSGWTNGHYYKAVAATNGIDWATAQTLAQTAGGYLVTLTSPAENDFVYSLISNNPALWFIDGAGNGIGPWTGGVQPDGSSEPGGGWTWATGEPFTFSPWAGGEPNNNGGLEDRICYFGSHTLIASNWNDLFRGNPSHGYVVERNSPGGDCGGSGGLVFQPLCTNLTITLSAAATNCVASTNVGIVVTNGLLGRYVADGTVQDSSGHGYNGTFTSPPQYIPGIGGQAFYFPWETAVGHVEFSTFPELTGATGFTATAHVKFYSNTNGSPANVEMFSQGIGIGEPTNSTPFGCTGINATSLTFLLQIGQNGNSQVILPFATVPKINTCSPGVFYTNYVPNPSTYPLYLSGNGSTQEWRHFAFTWRSSDGYTALYTNGVLAGATNVLAGAVIPPMYTGGTLAPGQLCRSGPMISGAASFGTTGGSASTVIARLGGDNGAVDNLRFYNRSLSPAEIQQIATYETNLTQITTNCTATEAVTTNALFCAANPGRLAARYALTNTAVELRWSSSSNGLYVLQSSELVAPSLWTNRWEGRGTGTNISVFESLTSHSQRYYRLLSTE